MVNSILLARAANGLNCLVDTLAPSGSALALAGALPKPQPSLAEGREQQVQTAVGAGAAAVLYERPQPNPRAWELKVVFERKIKFHAIARCARWVLGALALGPCLVSAQSAPPAPMPASQPELRRADAPAAGASAEDLERRADQLRAAKAYFEALDYYQGALSQKPNSAVLYNKLGINELLSARYQQAQKDFERATKLDAGYADAFNNLGVLEYLRRRYGRAIKQYQRAIAFDPDDASYYGNLGTAYFAKKEWERSLEAYGRAVSLDPGFFGRTSKGGVAGQISSPGDRAHFSYVLAKLYAKNGLSERSLEYLRRAIEEGYKIDQVYKDPDFTALRKDPRFIELMTAPPVSIPQ